MQALLLEYSKGFIEATDAPPMAEQMAARASLLQQITDKLVEATGRDDIVAVSVSASSKMGGMSCPFLDLDATLKSGAKLPMVFKYSPASPMKKMLGTAREALFYSQLGSSLADACVPRTYYTAGLMEEGEHEIMMERFENAVPSGVFFGPGNPNNWGVKDKLAAMCEDNPTDTEISAAAFRLYAKLHGAYWGEKALLDMPWLRGSGWAAGRDKEAWYGAQKIASDAWAKLSAARVDGSSSIRWDDHLVACLDVSFAKVDWGQFQIELASRPQVLVHGDCHPHNALWTNQRTADAKLALIDFEMVGIGSNGQELGQYLISHMAPERRRACEKELVAGYHRELIATLRSQGRAEAANAYSLEQCWDEYIAGGAGRWVWFVAYLGSNMPPPLSQYFHDQLAAFLRDHVHNPAQAPMPRV